MEVIRNMESSKLEGRSMKNACRAIELKVLRIFEQIGSYRLNFQVLEFLKIFRNFQETNLDPTVNETDRKKLDDQFQSLFRFYQFDKYIKTSDKAMNNQDMVTKLMKLSPENIDGQDGVNRKYPFDYTLLLYIFSNESAFEVRIQALKVLIQYFQQREKLMNELTRTELIVSGNDYNLYVDFLGKQDQLKKLINKVIYDEMVYMINKKSPS
jgi:hypothetical protein